VSNKFVVNAASGGDRGAVQFFQKRMVGKRAAPATGSFASQLSARRDRNTGARDGKRLYSFMSALITRAGAVASQRWIVA